MKTPASVLREAAQMCRERAPRMLAAARNARAKEASEIRAELDARAKEAAEIAAELDYMAARESASPNPIIAILRDMASADEATLSDARWVRGRVALMLETMEGGK